MTTICFTLKNTSFRVCVELTDAQYVYYQFATGQRSTEGMALDQDVMEEMKALLEHVEPEGEKRIEDEEYLSDCPTCRETGRGLQKQGGDADADDLEDRE